MDKQTRLVLVLVILLAISMYTNDNCEVKEASSDLIPFLMSLPPK